MDYKKLQLEIERIRVKHELSEFNFDTECIDGLGDLSNLLKEIFHKTLPELKLQVTERVSANGKHYVATVTNGELALELKADTDSDWLPDDFLAQLGNVPSYFGSHKMYVMINPAIGLTGQDIWYFCGSEEILKKARKEGIPLVFEGEDMFETPEYKKYGSE